MLFVGEYGRLNIEAPDTKNRQRCRVGGVDYGPLFLLEEIEYRAKKPTRYFILHTPGHSSRTARFCGAKYTATKYMLVRVVQEHSRADSILGAQGDFIVQLIQSVDMGEAKAAGKTYRVVREDLRVAARNCTTVDATHRPHWLPARSEVMSRGNVFHARADDVPAERALLPSRSICGRVLDRGYYLRTGEPCTRCFVRCLCRTDPAKMQRSIACCMGCGCCSACGGRGYTSERKPRVERRRS